MARARKKTRKRRRNTDGDFTEEQIQFILEGVEESHDVERGSSEITKELRDQISAYEDALYAAMMDTEEGGTHVIPRKGDNRVDPEVWAEDAPYNVFMTLNGEGVGIWDGRWDHLYTDANIEKLTRYLKKKVGKFADDTGGGSLNEAFMNAAFETGDVGPQPQDLVVAQKGDEWKVSEIEGRYHARFADQEDMERALLKKMNREGFFPTLWWESERGDPKLYEWEFVENEEFGAKANPDKLMRRLMR